ncbi:MAG: hypothetical protein Q9M91_02230 [Candidatus Dojkabacteria bacterium]|nr:hypothetical protein [Candidatus Dojkabacteria bacterium]MDQ7020642.1 hypothetical protein [Candidatus Dojkabacteria bacterium]
MIENPRRNQELKLKIKHLRQCLNRYFWDIGKKERVISNYRLLPLSSIIAAPFSNESESETRCTTALSTAAGLKACPSGCILATSSKSSLRILLLNSVSVKPGWMQLTLIPYFLNSSAQHSVNLIIAALVGAYTPIPSNVFLEPVL